MALGVAFLTGLLACRGAQAEPTPPATRPGDSAAPMGDFGRPDLSRYQNSESIHISGDGQQRIERRIFHPQAGTYAIRIDDHHQGQITIRDCVFIGPHGPGVDGLNPGNGGGVLAWQSDHVVIENCYFEYIQGFCVRIMGSQKQPATDIQVRDNRLLCLQADCDPETPWGWTADGIQFIRVAGPGNVISGNRCINRPGKSYQTDFINVYCSSGTQDSPLMISGNVLIGAGAGGLYNQYGCGIQLNDHPADEDGGQYVTARGNLLVDPGIAGMNINGGYRAMMDGNRVLMSRSHRTNLGTGPIKEHPTWAAMTLFNYSGGISRDREHVVRGNAVSFREPGGTAFINKTNPPLTVVADNDWNAQLDWNKLIADHLKP
jgi:Right handed beta helix region